MYAEERHQAIALLAKSQGRVEVMTLAADLDVTPETIRRDLSLLERQGVVRRVHGGAIPVERLGFEPALAARDTVMTAEKERIAKLAVAELPEEGAILLDAGSTTARVADILPTDREFTVVTNAIPIASLLADRPNITLLILGGRVRGRTLAAVDRWAVDLLRDTYVDVAFLGANGVSRQRGLTTPDSTEAGVKRAMIAAARRTVLVADHTKFGNDHFARFGELDDIDTVITDNGLDPDIADEIAAAGPRVVLA